MGKKIHSRSPPLSHSPPAPSPPVRFHFRARKIRKVSLETKPSRSEIANPPTAAIATTESCDGVASSWEIGSALDHLRSSDPLLAGLIDAYQIPTFKPPNPPFLALSRSIIYQQLATKAAESIYSRFSSLCGGEASILPDAVLSLSAGRLREIGVSGRKASYLHDLATKYKDGVLSDSSILEMDDETLVSTLTTVKGIGVWTVHMFMIFTLRRPDVLPVGDLGVRKGVQRLHGLKELPKPLEMERLCEKWKPYSSVGAWYMWRLMEAKGVLPISETALSADENVKDQ